MNLTSKSNFPDRLIQNLSLANKFISNHSKLREKEWASIRNDNEKKFQIQENIKNFRAYGVWLSRGMDTYGLRDDYFSDKNQIVNKPSLIKYFNNSFLNPHYLNSDHYNTDEKNPNEKSKYTFNLHNKKAADFRLKELIEECGEKFVLENLIKDNVGNCPISYNYKYIFYDEYNLCHLKYFYDLKKKIFDKTSNPEVVLEIGGGFGVLADYIIKNYRLKYISFDLPEANLLTSWYLSQTLKNKKLFLIDNYLEEGILNKKSLENFDIFILPPNVKLSEDIKVDLFINIRSMMEMDFDVVKDYFSFIHRYVSPEGYFYNINRYISNRTLFNAENSKKINASDLSNYPYDNNWEVVMSSTSYRHNHMHTLITKRNKNDVKNNIKDELKKIENISKKFLPSSIDLKRNNLRRNLKNWAIYLIFIFLRKIFSRKMEKIIKNKLINFKRVIFKKN